MGLGQEEMSALLGVSREWISKIENGHEDVSEFVELKMKPLEAELHTTRPNENPLHIAEEQSQYANPRTHGGKNPEHSIGKKPMSGVIHEQMEVNPRFAAKPQSPTKDECLAHITEYLNRAEMEPGGLGYAWRVMMKQFPLDDFDPKQK